MRLLAGLPTWSTPRRALSSQPRMWTPSDLVAFYDSPWASWMDRLAAEQPFHPLAQQRDPPDPFLSMLGNKGRAGEQEVMRRLFVDLGFSVVDLSRLSAASPSDGAAATAQAILERPDVIYQAPLAAGNFHGVADFLVREDAFWSSSGSRLTANELDAHGLVYKPRYAVWDAKLTRHAKPQQVIQLCCYADMLQQMEGEVSPAAALVLGGADAKIKLFNLVNHFAHYRSVRRRFLRFHAQFSSASGPPQPPKRGAPAGTWRGVADSILLEQDDLRLIARLSTRQAMHLRAAGIQTARALSGLPPGTSVAGIDQAALHRLCKQAALQLQYRDAPDQAPPFELLPWAPAVGLALLPSPSDKDIFFDLEGFPLAQRESPRRAHRNTLADFIIDDRDDEAGAGPSEHGREYLWGAATRIGAGIVDKAVVELGEDDALFDRDHEFLAWWAHSFVEEKAALEKFVDWVMEIWRTDPQMHIYHYGAYEVSALRRLTMRHATREEEVDELLRNGVLVDLYEVVRGALVLGTDNYSIKSVEKVYRAARGSSGSPAGRGTAIAQGDQSVVVYDAWLEDPDGHDSASSTALASLLEYNRDDCISTRQLADWLWELRLTHTKALHVPSQTVHNPLAAQSKEQVDEKSEKALQESLEVAKIQEQLLAGDEWPSESPLEKESVRSTLSSLILYHKRESKPSWWRRFDWLAAPPEALVEDERTLGMLRRTQTEPFKSSPRKRRLVYEYRSQDVQECKIEPGSAVVLRGHASPADDGNGPPTLGVAATLFSKDCMKGVFQLECAVEPPPLLSILPNEFVDPAPIPVAVREAVQRLISAPERPSALSRFLLRRPPNPLRPELQQNGSPSGAEASAHLGMRETPEWISQAALALEDDYLCVQGPPGTGKTFVGARAGAALLRAGKRVGILAYSHAAIDNLLAKTLEVMSEVNLGGRALKIGGDKTVIERMRARCSNGVTVDHIQSASGLKKSPLQADVLLVGATTWAFANEVMHEKVDTLIVDEAGQLPLANLIGASMSARNIILLGDQMQLPAPREGTHPAASGQSCLEYLLRGAPTVPSELGVFLSRSYRLHPSLCCLVSDIVYSGRLLPHPSTSSRSISPIKRSPSADAALAHPLLSRGSGIQCIEVEHDGNTFASPEEARIVASLFAELLCRDFNDGAADPRPLSKEDILVVTPYNAQVQLIRSVLPHGARVGTVDRFQGQEAPVVIISLCHSSFSAVAAGEDDGCSALSNGGGRGLSFVLNLNRLNVALTRAQCLAVMVASPELINVSVNSMREARELNFLARIIECGGPNARTVGAEAAGG